MIDIQSRISPINGYKSIYTNDLELAATILGYAGVQLAVMKNRHIEYSVWPVLLMYMDNTIVTKIISKKEQIRPRDGHCFGVTLGLRCIQMPALTHNTYPVFPMPMHLMRMNLNSIKRGDRRRIP